MLEALFRSVPGAVGEHGKLLWNTGNQRRAIEELQAAQKRWAWCMCWGVVTWVNRNSWPRVGGAKGGHLPGRPAGHAVALRDGLAHEPALATPLRQRPRA